MQNADFLVVALNFDEFVGVSYFIAWILNGSLYLILDLLEDVDQPKKHKRLLTFLKFYFQYTFTTIIWIAGMWVVIPNHALHPSMVSSPIHLLKPLPPCLYQGTGPITVRLWTIDNITETVRKI